MNEQLKALNTRKPKEEREDRYKANENTLTSIANGNVKLEPAGAQPPDGDAFMKVGPKVDTKAPTAA
jgi:hypothetical protein